MKNKIFISINIPSKVKKRLFLAIEKWQELPVKWEKEADLHITLVYLGFTDEEVVLEICEKVKKACEDVDIFDIRFDQIELFPSAEEPKVIALTGEPSEELKNLVNAIEKELGISTSPKKSFRPHITLGRVKKHKWETLEDKPLILEKFPLTVDANSVDVMTSQFSSKENRYSILDSCPLQ
ncbi:MAG: 2'-5' RNA ligase [Candidatus Moranbacteria bacterium GW2011_GWF2_36_839]|nr:MAG: 2'-5' RNA ligase [Candidatus Moranbacteria bacterium GW2011_GWF1_36_78]KKQ17734.1 MAG: 2'-5' RNA ligase [Candidatus Moranbacteria bacterium GW2011_GWF2_36_839]HAT73436.1 RNA 2',3'-cyclic phosphodiesterase [Candidatus Moranbacteria bacterium]HBY10798.1 RNA 2',3'-cyclic phosphodiesterase [Candidatus Moranbacteria bacterium]